jgi:site-specific DNA recombinase
MEKLKLLKFGEAEKRFMQQELNRLQANWITERKNLGDSLCVALAAVRDRLNRLTDAYIDRLIDKDTFEAKRTVLVDEQTAIEKQRQDIAKGSDFPDRLKIFLELAGKAYLTYELASFDEKREIVLSVTSNRTVDRKNVIVMLNSEYEIVANRNTSSDGSPSKGVARTMDELINNISNHVGNFKGGRREWD